MSPFFLTTFVFLKGLFRSLKVTFYVIVPLPCLWSQNNANLRNMAAHLQSHANTKTRPSFFVSVFVHTHKKIDLFTFSLKVRHLSLKSRSELESYFPRSKTYTTRH